MKIAIAADHGGFELKQHLIKYLSASGHSVADFGTDNNESVDYPIYSTKVTDAVLANECELGILACGTGIGMSLAANKVAGIRAAVCNDIFSARMARAHNDANILCIGARVIGVSLAEVIIDEFLETAFEGGRHAERIGMFK